MQPARSNDWDDGNLYYGINLKVYNGFVSRKLSLFLLPCGMILAIENSFIGKNKDVYTYMKVCKNSSGL